MEKNCIPQSCFTLKNIPPKNENLLREVDYRVRGERAKIVVKEFVSLEIKENQI